MALVYYQNYSNNIARTPNQSYREDVQAFNDSQWDNTTQEYIVLEQRTIGSSNYDPIDVQVDNAIDMGTGLKKDDDYKVFNFQEISHDVEYGLLYQYAKCTWITTNKSEIGSVFQSITVRKCNNVAKWIDPTNGAILEEPCVIDYDIGASRPRQDKDIITADNSMVLVIQGNDRTQKLKQNQRFIFNGRCFKLSGFNVSLQNDILLSDTTLYYYDLYLDMEQPSDDIQNNIANRFEYQYSINIIQDITEQVNGFVGQLDVDIMLNGEVVSRNVTWVGNEFVTVVNGKYTLHGSAGNVATIKAYIEGNQNVYDEINITIVDTIKDSYDIVINPLSTEIRQNQILVFDADLYKNGVKQTDVVTALPSGVDTNCYTLTNVGNKFTLICKRFSSKPLQILFTSGIHTKTVTIKLKSAF